MEFKELLQFINEKMEMRALYQPIMISYLTTFPKYSASKKKITEHIKSIMTSQHYLGIKIPKDWNQIPVFNVLVKREVVKKIENQFVLNVDRKLSAAELEEIRDRCNQKIIYHINSLDKSEEEFHKRVWNEYERLLEKDKKVEPQSFAKFFSNQLRDKTIFSLLREKPAGFFVEQLEDTTLKSLAEHHQDFIPRFEEPQTVNGLPQDIPTRPSKKNLEVPGFGLGPTKEMMVFGYLTELEQGLRKLVIECFADEPKWWREHVPKGTRDSVQQRYKEFHEGGEISMNNDDRLKLTDFGQLAEIILKNYKIKFKNIFEDEKSLEVKLKELKDVRDGLYHSRITVDDITYKKVEVYFHDIYEKCRLAVAPSHMEALR
jgi:hypothetical protein